MAENFKLPVEKLNKRCLYRNPTSKVYSRIGAYQEEDIYAKYFPMKGHGTLIDFQR